MKIAIGADHAGYLMKETVKKYLHDKEIQFTDFGTFKMERTDYPDYAYKVANAVSKQEADLGILICGTGIGMCIAANKVKGIRAGSAWNTKSAELGRLHNNANILCLGARLLGEDEAVTIVETWLNTSFEGGRHEKRIEKIHSITGI